MLTVACKSCGARLALPENLAGAACECVRCGRVFVAPGSDVPATAATAQAQAPALLTTTPAGSAPAAGCSSPAPTAGGAIKRSGVGASSFLSRSMVSLVVGLLYVAACACPAVKVRDPGLELINGLLVSLGGKPDAQGPEYEEVLGVDILLTGWRSPLIIPWSANSLLLGGWILLLCRKNAVALGFGIAAALAGLAGLSTWSLLPERAQLLVGSYLWQASLIAFALGAFAIWFREPRKAVSI